MLPLFHECFGDVKKENNVLFKRFFLKFFWKESVGLCNFVSKLSGFAQVGSFNLKFEQDIVQLSS